MVMGSLILGCGDEENANGGAMGGSGALGDNAGASGMNAGPAGAEATFSFFITSANPGGADSEVGGNFGGLAGADGYCQELAAGIGSTRSWAAYLSADGVDARSRIGAGPWFNVDGVMIASDVANLHEEGSTNNLDGETALTENGEQVSTSGPNQHDIVTGSLADGTAAPNHCESWSVGDDTATAQVGHHNRAGGGAAPTSWNSAHESAGCSIDALRDTGGEGLFYCFATD